MKLALDTDIIVAAMRSPTGASVALLRAVRRGEIHPLANVGLALEYEATCLSVEHGFGAGLGAAEVDAFVNAVIAMAEPVETHFLWRPQLRAPVDELVLEAAVNGRANAIVAFNQKNYGRTPINFAVEVIAPFDVLRRIKS